MRLVYDVRTAAVDLLIKHFSFFCRQTLSATSLRSFSFKRLLVLGWAAARNEDRKPAVKKEGELRQRRGEADRGGGQEETGGGCCEGDIHSLLATRGVAETPSLHVKFRHNIQILR
ncbi:hypothetical protein NQZ68_008557 [Dissostichus eleginoides]|nr:hypothetical protein NQZ68_008557 [Dissostichus eleginoides]